MGKSTAIGVKAATSVRRYLSRQNGRWGIDRRVTIRDMDEVADFKVGSDDRLGGRDSPDPSYAAFASPK